MIVSEQSRRATLTLLPLGAFECAADGAWDFVSPALAALLGGMPTSSLLGRGWLEHVHPEDVDVVLMEYRQACESGTAWRQEFRMLTRAGRVVHVGVDANPLPPDGPGRGPRLIGLVHDRSRAVRDATDAASRAGARTPAAVPASPPPHVSDTASIPQRPADGGTPVAGLRLP